MNANLREWNAMKKEKIEKLKAAGFEVGDTASFLKLTPDEAKRVETLRTETKP